MSPSKALLCMSVLVCVVFLARCGGGGSSANVSPPPPPPPVAPVKASCTVDGSTAAGTTLVGISKLYHANPEPADGTTCDWNFGSQPPGGFDTQPGSSCSVGFVPTGGGVFSEKVKVTNGANSITVNCPSLTVQDFNLSVVPPSLTATPGSQASFKVTASSMYGFTGLIDFTALLSVPGWSSHWNPSTRCTVPAGGACSSTFSVSSGTAIAGIDAQLTFTGTHALNLQAKPATAWLHVRQPPNGFEARFVTNMPWQSAGSIAAARFDSDDFVDIAVTDLLPDKVHLLRGLGNGDFLTQSDLSLQAISVTAGDFNNDAHSDLAFTTLPLGFSGTQVSVWTGDGQGRFNSRWSYSFGPNSACQRFGRLAALASADVNNDGRPDLLVGHAGFSVFLGTGNATALFTRSGDFGCGPPDSESTTLVSGDFNSDGKPDVVVVDAVRHLLILWLGDGAGKFAPATPVSGSFEGPVAAGDFDNDGNFDVAVKATPEAAKVYFGRGDGTFSSPLLIADPAMNPLGSVKSVLAASDLNGDGLSDIVFSGPLDPNYPLVSTVLDIYFAHPGRTFTSPAGALLDGSYAIVVADVNGDGWPDVLVPSGAQLVELVSK